MSNGPSSIQPDNTPQSLSPQPHPTPGPATPGVWTWYVVYCVFMGLIYLLCTSAAVLVLVFADTIAADDPEINAIETRLFSSIMCAVSLPLMLLFATAPFLPRTKLAWIWGFITIGIGMTSACCLPVTIPLLIFWIKPGTKDFLHVK